MNRSYTYTANRGISLIEALIAIVVLSLGLLAVAQFQGSLSASSGLTKARAEATQLAQDKLEELRNLSQQSQYAAIADGNDTPNGINTTFNREWVATPNGNRLTLEVTVGWDDPKSGTQSVALSSIIAWDDPALSASFTDGTGGGGFVKPPTGRAIMEGDKTYGPDGIPNDAIDNGDGTLDYVAEDGSRELIDAVTGDVLMIVSDGSEFSTIAGRLYYNWATTPASSLPDPSIYFIMTSDAAYCAVIDDALQLLPDTGTTQYQYYNYRCYVGGEWYGNVGVVSTSRTNVKHRICVGDPTVVVQYNDDGTINSSSDHPALSTTRIYRGYKNLDSLMPTSVGIGMSTGEYVAIDYIEHDFLVTALATNAVDSSCETPMENITPSPFVGSPGDFFCLSDACPDTLPTGDVPSTVISGTITNVVSSTALPEISLSITTGTCTGSYGAASKSYDYSCEISWLGWTGGTWEGSMTVTGAQICSKTVNEASLVDIELEPGLTWNDVVYLDAAIDPGAIYFSDFPPSVTDLAMDLTVATTCP